MSARFLAWLARASIHTHPPPTTHPTPDSAASTSTTITFARMRGCNWSNAPPDCSTAPEVSGGRRFECGGRDCWWVLLLWGWWWWGGRRLRLSETNLNEVPLFACSQMANDSPRMLSR